jgi:hypothetical protein
MRIQCGHVLDWLSICLIELVELGALVKKVRSWV